MLGFLKIRYVWWISCITSWWRWGYYDFFAERPFWRICFRPAAAWKILLGSDMQRWDLHGEEKCIHFFFGHFVSGCYQISSALTQCFEISQKVSSILLWSNNFRAKTIQTHSARIGWNPRIFCAIFKHRQKHEYSAWKWRKRKKSFKIDYVNEVWRRLFVFLYLQLSTTFLARGPQP